MGQKVHPYGFRVGYNKDWHSHWFAKHQFAEFLAEDLKLKRDLKRRFGGGGRVFRLSITTTTLAIELSRAVERPSTPPPQ